MAYPVEKQQHVKVLRGSSNPGLEELTELLFYQSDSDLFSLIYLNPSEHPEELISKGLFHHCCDHLVSSEFCDFITDCKEMILLNQRDESFLKSMLLHSKMQSAMAVPVLLNGNVEYILLFNSLKPYHYGSKNQKKLLDYLPITEYLAKRL